MFLRSFVPALVLVAGFWAPVLRAAEPGPFVAAVSAAYPQFKMAWFYCRTGNGMLAGEELDAFNAAWRAIRARFGSSPPGPFARDLKWKVSLDAITDALNEAGALIHADDTPHARDLLVSVRDELGALRRRNGVVIFSDHVDAYGAIVDRAVALRSLKREVTTLSDSDIAAFAALAGELRAAVENLRARAPEALKNDSGFAGSIDGNLASIGKLERGIRTRHAKAIFGSVVAVRADFILLFTRYG